MRSLKSFIGSFANDVSKQWFNYWILSVVEMHFLHNSPISIYEETEADTDFESN